MDFTQLVTLLTSLGYSQYVGYLVALIGICSILAAILPPATVTSPKWWKVVREVLDWCAANKGNASNAITPKTTSTPSTFTVPPGVTARVIAGSGGSGGTVAPPSNPIPPTT